jgi:mono/diheme cytochrome c family protein
MADVTEAMRSQDMHPHPLRIGRACIALLALCSAAAVASDRSARTALLPLYEQECASCHIAYAPRLLPASAWQRLVGDLSRHFGTDASVEAAVAAELSTWLTTHAASGRRAAEAPPDDRITRSAWFVREHRKLVPGTFKRTAVGSAANCAACHRDAARGRFDEHAVQIPGEPR